MLRAGEGLTGFGNDDDDLGGKSTVSGKTARALGVARRGGARAALPYARQAMTRALMVVGLLLGSSCAGLSAARRAENERAAEPAVAALRAADFAQAQTLADDVLAKNRENPRAAAVAAVARWRKTAHDFVADAATVVASFVGSAMLRGDLVSQDFLDFALGRADTRLAEIDALLAVAEKDPGFSLDLCLACWRVDWNRSGELDEFDERLFEVERDADGSLLPLDDPRRRPTFRFDVADVTWLRALVHFQRAALSIALAYDPNVTWRSRTTNTLTLKLRDGAKLGRAKALLLSALDLAGRCRDAVLAETDDEREWVPSPRQKSAAIPLPVDEALFETWRGVLDDSRALLESRAGLELPALVQLGKRPWPSPPPGFLDVGAFFSQPRDLVISQRQAERLDRGHRQDPGAFSELLGQLLGPSYRASMPPSPLIDRLRRMSTEIERGEESFERKLRYLFWLN